MDQDIETKEDGMNSSIYYPKLKKKTKSCRSISRRRSRSSLALKNIEKLGDNENSFDILYNSDEDLEIFNTLDNFLTHERLLVKSEREKISNESIKSVPTESCGYQSFIKLSEIVSTNLDSGNEDKEPLAITDSELMNFCDIFEEKSTDKEMDQVDEEKNFPNSCVKEIFEDFSELEDANYSPKITNTEIRYRKKIKKTYQNKSKKSKNDIPLSQTVSENLLDLTSYFLPKSISENEISIKPSENLRILEESSIVLNLQNMFDNGNAMFYGNQFDQIQITEIQKFTEREKGLPQKYFPGISQENGNCFLSAKKDKLLRINNKIELNCIKSPISYIDKENKNVTEFQKDSDLLELWPDDNLLQKIETHVFTPKRPPECLEAVTKRHKFSYKANYDEIKFKTECMSSNIEKTIPNVEKKKVNITSNASFSKPGFPSFITASQKVIHISEDALNRAQKLLESTEEDV